jgi:hypothetical protein
MCICVSSVFLLSCAVEASEVIPPSTESYRLSTITRFEDRSTMLKVGMTRIRFPMRSSAFSIDIILPAALWPWGRLSI